MWRWSNNMSGNKKKIKIEKKAIRLEKKRTQTVAQTNFQLFIHNLLSASFYLPLCVFFVFGDRKFSVLCAADFFIIARLIVGGDVCRRTRHNRLMSNKPANKHEETPTAWSLRNERRKKLMFEDFSRVFKRLRRREKMSAKRNETLRALAAAWQTRKHCYTQRRRQTAQKKTKEEEEEKKIVTRSLAMFVVWIINALLVPSYFLSVLKVLPLTTHC